MGLGAAVTGLNPAWSDDEVATQLGDADASVLVTMPDLADRARSLGMRRVIVLGEAAGTVPLAEAAGRSSRASAPRDRLRLGRPAAVLERDHRAAQGGHADPPPARHRQPPDRPRPRASTTTT